MSESRPLSPATLAVAAGRPAAAPDAPLNPPIVPASSFHAGGPMEYAREAAPTTAAVEAALGALEHGTAIAFSSGMAAANAVMDLVPVGAVVVAPSAAYTGVAVRLRELAAIGRIELRIVEADDSFGKSLGVRLGGGSRQDPAQGGGVIGVTLRRTAWAEIP